MPKGGSHLKQNSPAPKRRPAPSVEESPRTPASAPATAPARPHPSDTFEIIEQRMFAEQQANAQPRRQPESTDRTTEPAPRRNRSASFESESAPRRSRPAPTEPEAPRRRTQPPAAPVSDHGNPPPRSTPHRRKKHGGGAGLWILIVLLVAVMAFSLYKLGSAILGYAEGRATYSQLQAEAIVPRLPDSADETDSEDESAPPVVVSEVPFTVDWQMLKDANSDIVAWLYCPTIESINYPVVQSTDNETYLYKDFNGDRNSGGTLFADYGSTIGLLSSHLIIYGHNMKDNSMFGKLKNYLTWEFYEENPIFYLLTPNQNYRIELLDCQTIDADVENFPTYFSEGGTSFGSYIAKMTSNAYWVNQEADYESYQLVTMSTCTSSSDDRLILQGVLVPIQ